jgi:amino acid adenylation domain-containing protein
MAEVMPVVSVQVLRMAAAQPSQPAIIDGNRVVSYEQLADTATSLGRRLHAAGAGPGTVVALYLHRSAELVTAALATLLSGAAYLCLDPTQPAARNRYMAEDSNVPLVLTDRRAWHADLETAAKVVYLDDPGQAGDAIAGDDATVAADMLAYVNYTSGSSGAPKGVLIEHGGLANLVTWYGDYYQVKPGDVMTQLARPTFDALALEIWPCLGNGATLRIVPSALLEDPDALVAWFRQSGVTVGFVPTPLAEEMLAAWLRSPSGQLPLRAMLVGGDRLHRYPPPGLPFRVFNNYGPTECTVVATCCEVTANPNAAEAPPIGKPIPGIKAHVLDEELRPVADGEPGMLYLAGAGVARGYLGEPNGSSFLPDVADPGERMYATGDMVRAADDGTLFFLGRADSQLKIGGIRIEPAEVEAALLRCESVRQAAVVGHHPAPGEPAVLVGYVVSDADDGPALRLKLTEELPGYLVPAVIVRVGSMPTDAHGKLDRKDLSGRRLDIAPARPGADDALSRALSKVWCEVFGLESADPDRDFFELGGDSLRIIRLVAKARGSGITLQPEDVHRHPVLADLAQAISENG